MCRDMTRHAIVLMLQMASHQPNRLPPLFGFAELAGGCGGDGHGRDRTDLDARGYPANDRRRVARTDCARIRAHAESRGRNTRAQTQCPPPPPLPLLSARRLHQPARTRRQPLGGVGARLCASGSTPRTLCEYSEYHVSTHSSRVGHLGALVRSAPAPSSQPADSVRGLVFRRGVRRGRCNFAGDSSVPSHQARTATPGQGALHRTHATRQRQNNNPTPPPTSGPRTDGARTCMAWRPRRRLNCAWAPLCSSPSPGRKARSSTWPVPQVPPAPPVPIFKHRTHPRAHTAKQMPA